MFKFHKENRVGILDKLGGLDFGKLSNYLDGLKEGDYELSITSLSEDKTHPQLKSWYRGVNLALDFMKNNESNPLIEICGKRVEFPLTKEGVDLFLKMRVALPIMGLVPSKTDMKKDEFSKVLDRLDMWLKKYMDLDLFEHNLNIQGDDYNERD